MFLNTPSVTLLLLFAFVVLGDIEKEPDYYFSALQSITSEIANQIDSDFFVSLKPNKQFAGGFGNVLWHFMEVQGMAMATKRHAIFNNAAINALFSHPNLKNSTTPSSSSYWQLKSLSDVQKYFDGKKGPKKSELFPCGKVSLFPLASFSKDFYVHGESVRLLSCVHVCFNPYSSSYMAHPLSPYSSYLQNVCSSLFSGCFGNNLMHPNIKPVLASFMGLHKTFPTKGDDYR